MAHASAKPLPIECPKCRSEGCLVIVKSLTVITCACASCRHTWATDIELLPPDVQARFPDVIDRLSKS